MGLIGNDEFCLRKRRKLSAERSLRREAGISPSTGEAEGTEKGRSEGRKRKDAHSRPGK